MRLGYHCASFHFPESDASAFESAISLARRLDEAGFDWFSTMDHLWQLPFVGQRDEPYFDAYTTLPAVARETDRMEMGALVTSPHYRNPAMLGRQLTTLDHASDGRAVFGIGAGWFEEEYDAYGFEYPDPERRVHDLRDTVSLVQAMWRKSSPLSHETDRHSVEDLYLEPKPVQDGGPDVLVGGGGEDLLLKAVADLADRWNVPGVSPDAFERKLGILAEYCERFGTDFDAIEKTVLQTAVIRDSAEAAHDAYERLQRETAAADPTPRDDHRGLVGTPEEVLDGLETFDELGAEMVMVRAERNDPETIDHLVEDVLTSMD
ncbi:Flavin-dependent oxidoreductase, luciferase family (includes alkanesulfonate monooxygenase SsuD and methylene tetrahydromethanopterin reductase) [Halorientalis persicus]|uniref:Flavin-dependent oxidoreductase, luciferase family (Includes alkanesulfonate monooxygenase SsuD and methylene tetrahydromethanopterin reductase) n=1 Tax=Halorientalis persicus TaxID=1367881 RepID=A0A1H8MT42_9EURY|nr:LLM class flavin-dependent oxidoreductase [Halorientalis persicus]SEO20592.1 Flavin-dependent oxidoreductase, luciferase family (includes alkanesulfonate monooxygenase SsuD and methylene tetrahydromethanopterin reductase) [Halorientalis persicus]